MTSSSDDSDSERAWYLFRFAIESQSKFTYFMVGLTFAILGLSIQTTTHATWLTAVAWVFLLASALWGIFKLQWDYTYARANGLKIEEERLLSQRQEVMLTGRTIVDPATGKAWTSDELKDEISKRTKKVDKISRRMAKIANENEWRFTIHTWCFITGVFSLAIDKIFLR